MRTPFERQAFLAAAATCLGFIDIAASWEIAPDKVPGLLEQYGNALREAFA